MNRKNQPPKLDTSLSDALTAMPDLISDTISGLDPKAHDFLNALIFNYEMGAEIFQTASPHHEDWVILFVLLANDSQNRATVTKNIVEITGRAYGTVRASLQRFERLGYTVSQQKIGRSELYVPTVKLKEAVNAASKKYWANKP